MIAPRLDDARELSRQARTLLVEVGEVGGPARFLPTAQLVPATG